ncbi:MAG: endonuclease VII domain-containing protein [Luteolibacter sp.]
MWRLNHPDYHRNWRRNNPDVRDPRRKLDSFLKRRYKISLDDYNILLSQQEGRCAICRRPPSDGARLCVDHCHASETKKVRALLCRLCNVGLGAFKDNPEFTNRATTYLLQHVGS